jgi:hypothetical protein
LRSMEFLNNSLLARLGWKLTSNQPLLWVDALRGKYLKNGVSFLNAPPNLSSSWIWKGLLKNRKVVQKGACIAISSGLNVEVWQSPWIPLNPNFRPSPNANLVSLPTFNVADLVLADGCSWNASLLADLFDPSTVQNILSIYLPQHRGLDKWTWAPSPSGTFSVKSAHELSAIPGGRTSPLAEVAWLSLWGLKIQARLKHLLWKIAWNILPSRDNISRFVVQVAEGAWVCLFCKGPLESLCHIFLECSLATFLWRNSPWPSIINGFSNKPIVDWILAIIYPAQYIAISVDDVKHF